MDEMHRCFLQQCTIQEEVMGCRQHSKLNYTPRTLYPRKRTNEQGGCVDPRAGLNVSEDRKSPARTGIFLLLLQLRYSNPASSTQQLSRLPTMLLRSHTEVRQNLELRHEACVNKTLIQVITVQSIAQDTTTCGTHSNSDTISAVPREMEVKRDVGKLTETSRHQIR